MSDRVLSAAAARAPRGPGVYLFVGARNDLLYVGKARNISRRLADHARNLKRARVGGVRWIECTDEADALCLEADVVVALSPPFNAVMAGDTYEYVSLMQHGLRTTFVLGDRPAGRNVYGGFPHLGKGKVSWPAVRSKAGYSAVLRLLWVAHEGPRLPSRLHGDSPPAKHTATIGDASALRDFLSGRSRRLLSGLARAVDSPDVPEFMRGTLRRDVDAAEQFYWLGPCRARALRTRHALRQPVDFDAFRRAVVDELVAAVGDLGVAASG